MSLRTRGGKSDGLRAHRSRVQDSRITTLAGIAAALNERRIPTKAGQGHGRRSRLTACWHDCAACEPAKAQPPPAMADGCGWLRSLEWVNTLVRLTISYGHDIYSIEMNEDSHRAIDNGHGV